MKIACILGHDWRVLFTRDFVEANYPIVEIAMKCRRCGRIRIEIEDAADLPQPNEKLKALMQSKSVFQ